MKLSERLNEIIASKSLLNHPFYQAWTRGKLSKDVLRRYAGQYWAQVSSFPRFVSSVHSRCPQIEARKVLLENLVDEELHGTDHPELWMRFAEGLGASRAEVEQQLPLPETTAMVDGFFELGLGTWDVAAGALLVREAGGIVTDWAGDPDAWLVSGDTIAAPPAVHAHLLAHARASSDARREADFQVERGAPGGVPGPPAEAPR